ncbi:MAG: RsmE family RNA methyltransferase [Desulfobacterales bacterium]
MRHFLIDPDQLDRARPSIIGPDVRHIRKVLRMKPGDPIRLSDGRGRIFDGRISGLSPQKVWVEILREEKPAESPAGPFIGVAQALLKDKKMDGLVRQLTELGVVSWIPFVSDRSVPRPDEGRMEHRIERWRKIAREAVKQCRRPAPPLIREVLDWEGLFTEAANWDVRILFWERSSTLLDSRSDPAGQKAPRLRILLILGPEGGFSDAEADRANRRGWMSASLGPRILRAETAAVSACALAQYLFGDMGPRPRSGIPEVGNQ